MGLLCRLNLSLLTPPYCRCCNKPASRITPQTGVAVEVAGALCAVAAVCCISVQTMAALCWDSINTEVP